MFKLFKKSEPKQETVVVEKVVEVVRDVPHVVRKQGKFRLGMWVDYSGRVGILYRNLGPRVEVHLVDKNGFTTEIVKVTPDEIKQARKSQIPECRKGSVDNFDYQE